MHLLREHRLLFRGRGLSPTPLSDAEFNERIEAMRRRNRGGRQRAREARRACRMDAADGDGGERELLHERSMVDVAYTVIDSAIITAAQR